jgi:hypothetical protein
MNIINLIRKQDAFGHKVSFNFGSWLERKKERDIEYKTLIGGFFSLLIKIIFMAIMLYYGL